MITVYKYAVEVQTSCLFYPYLLCIPQSSHWKAMITRGRVAKRRKSIMKSRRNPLSPVSLLSFFKRNQGLDSKAIENEKRKFLYVSSLIPRSFFVYFVPDAAILIKVDQFIIIIRRMKSTAGYRPPQGSLSRPVLRYTNTT